MWFKKYHRRRQKSLQKHSKNRINMIRTRRGFRIRYEGIFVAKKRRYFSAIQATNNGYKCSRVSTNIYVNWGVLRRKTKKKTSQTGYPFALMHNPMILYTIMIFRPNICNHELRGFMSMFASTLHVPFGFLFVAQHTVYL